MGKRLHYIDIAKGILMLMVIMVHVPLALKKMGFDYPYVNFPTNELMSFYVGFFMQAFFLLSGLTSNFEKPFRVFLMNNVKGLLIPFLFLGISTKYCESLLFHDNFWTQKAGDESYFFLVETLWFLAAMFIARFIYWTVHHITSNDILRASLLILVLLVGVLLNNAHQEVKDPAHYHNFFHYRNAMCLAIFLWIGNMAKRYPQLMEYTKYLGWGYIPLLVISKFIPQFHGVGYTDTTTLTLLQIPQYILFATLGTCLIIEISKWMGENQHIEFVGRNSLAIYGFHFLVMQCVAVALSWVFVPEGKVMSLCFYMLYLIVVLLITSLMAKFMTYRPMNYLMGKF